MVCIKMDKPADVLGLVAPDLAIQESRLCTLGAFGAARGEAAPLVEAVGLEEAAQRRIGR